jgi:catechol 2,3-dioxygenase-like lactoylglutathione lyase family enzyme
VQPRLTFLSLAVDDVARSKAFYVDGLGWPLAFEAPGEVVFVRVADTLVLSLWDRAGFTAEVGEPARGLAPVTLAYNCLGEAEVDDVYAGMLAAGATAVQEPRRREWGGFSGYVADPDGFRWEVAWNPSDLGREVVEHGTRPGGG